MRKITKVINIFNFEELKPEIKSKIIGDYREILVNDNFEVLEGNFNYMLEGTYKLYDCKIEYDFSYSQGDGVCFYKNKCDLLSYTVLKNKDVKNANVFEKYLMENNLVNDNLLNYLNEDYNLGIFKNDSGYTHARTCSIDYEFYNGDDEQETTNKYIGMIADKLYSVYLSICKEMEKIGYSCYDVSDDEVKEFISCNEYEFLENGKIYQE